MTQREENAMKHRIFVLATLVALAACDRQALPPAAPDDAAKATPASVPQPAEAAALNRVKPSAIAAGGFTRSVCTEAPISL